LGAGASAACGSGLGPRSAALAPDKNCSLVTKAIKKSIELDLLLILMAFNVVKFNMHFLY